MNYSAHDFEQSSEALPLLDTYRVIKPQDSSVPFWSFFGDDASGWVLTIAYLIDRRCSSSLKWYCEYTKLQHMKFHQSAKHTITAATLPMRQGFVWVTMNFSLVPYFFKDFFRMNGFVRRSITGHWYSRFLENQVLPPLRQRGCLTSTMVNQYGAITYTVRCVKNVIQANFFDEYVISRTFSISWPARSSDLNPYDFWLRYFLKDQVYHRRITNLANLEAGLFHSYWCVACGSW